MTGNRDVSLPVSLEWHVWLSSSGNNYYAVHRSFSSGASVWRYHGILPCPILSAKPAYVISSHNCHRNVSLPSGASLWNGMFGRVEGQYTTPGPPRPGVVTPYRVLSMGQIELNFVQMKNWISWDWIFWRLDCELILKWIVSKGTVFDIETVLTLKWIVWNRSALSFIFV